jgi:hypothetical protein
VILAGREIGQDQATRRHAREQKLLAREQKLLARELALDAYMTTLQERRCS